MDGFALHTTVARSDTEHARFLASLNNPDAGVVSLRVRPDLRRLGWLSRDILAALGKRRDVSGKGRNDAEDTALVPVWLLAHRISDVIVAGAELCPERILTELVTVAASCRLRLWLVSDNSTSEYLARLAVDWPVVEVPEADFNSRWAAVSTVEGHAPDAAVPGWVPDSDFVVFLEDVAEFCTPDDADQAVKLFESAVGEFRRTLSETAVLDEETVTELVRGLLAGCVTVPSATVKLRAFQAAAFELGWYVQLDLPRLFATGVVDRAAVTADQATWVKLRAYRQPHRAAVCALHACDVSCEQQQTTRVGDVSEDGSEVAVDGVVRRLPSGTEVFLRAARLHRLFAGANEGDLLFVADDGSPLGLRAFTRAISDASAELGVLLSGSQIDRKRPTARQWRQRSGVSVQHLIPAGDRR